MSVSGTGHAADITGARGTELGGRGRSCSCHRAAAAALPGVGSALGFRARGAHRSWADGGCLGRVCAGRARRGRGAGWRPGLGRKKREVPTGPEVKRRGEERSWSKKLEKGFSIFG